MCFSHMNDQLAHSTSVACVHVLPLLGWHLSKTGKAGEYHCRRERGNEEGEADDRGSGEITVMVMP